MIISIPVSVPLGILDEGLPKAISNTYPNYHLLDFKVSHKDETVYILEAKFEVPASEAKSVIVLLKQELLNLSEIEL